MNDGTEPAASNGGAVDNTDAPSASRTGDSIFKNLFRRRKAGVLFGFLVLFTLIANDKLFPLRNSEFILARAGFDDYITSR